MSASIAHAPWLKAPATRALMEALEAARPGGARFVGGCVRNALMHQQVDDIDVATQMTPEAVAACARAAGFAVHETGIEHGTLTIVANGAPFEVTTLRRDVSTDGRRATVAFTESWEEDAQRRDFRLNALYASAAGEVFDPTGGGLEDARAGRIVFVGDPATRLAEDVLRVLRFFRFNAWYARGAPEAAGLAACAAMAGEIAKLSAERVWKEVKKLLAAPTPLRALEAMAGAGVWEAALPEASLLARLRALLALEQSLLLAPDAMARLAAAMPDEGAAKALGQRLKLSNEERARLAGALAPGERIASFMSMREVRRALYRLGAQAFADRVKLAWAEQGGDAAQWRALLAMADAWAAPRLPLTGEEVLAAGVPAGPKVGAVLREVEAWWIDADFPDDKLAVAERLKAVARGLS